MDFYTRYAAYQAAIEQYLEGLFSTDKPYGRLQEAMLYSLLGGGKRIRPVLTLELARLGGIDWHLALPYACALELVHTYSLIHDDLPCMDDDDFRRGKPTNHKVFGQANAVLAGDALLTTAFAVLAEASLPAERVQRGIAALANAAGPNGMVGGQVLDLLGEGNSLQEEEILAIESLKTGCMIEAAARLGAIAAGSTPEEEAAAAAYARKLGLAFQVRDDILDVMGDEGEFGKPIGSDQANQKSTFVALKGIAACEAWVQELTQEAVAFLAPFSGREFLCELAHFLARRTK